MNVVPSLLTASDEARPFMLLDGDDAGHKMTKDMQNDVYQDAKDRVTITDEYADFEYSEIEDLFPVDYFVHVIDPWERRLSGNRRRPRTPSRTTAPRS